MAKIQQKQLNIQRLANVRVRAQGDLTLTGEQTIDGVLTSADRILCDQQTPSTEDGIYLTAAGAWVREKDLGTGESASGRSTYVEEGTVDGGAIFTCTDAVGSDAVGTDDLTFAELGAGETNLLNRQEVVTTESVVNADTALADLLDNVPIDNASVTLFLNGQMMKQGAGFDYSISSQTITWLASSGSAPNLNTNDELNATYQST